MGYDMKVVYVAGPFRGASSWDIECNIRRAEELSLEVWRAGAVGLCPHANTRFFHGAEDDDVWLAGDIELLRRSDAIILAPGWELSSGVAAELVVAEEMGIPVFKFTELDLLRRWIEDQV